MEREILINMQKGQTRIAIVEDGRLEDFFIDVEHHESILGNVYKGKVESILPSINGAFINIGQERNGFLYLTEVVNPMIEEDIAPHRKLINKLFNIDEGKKKTRPRGKDNPSLKIGQEILVQVVKDPFSTKGARLTTHISLAGRFIVYMPYDTHNGVSKKIEDREERQRLKEVLGELNFVKSGGFIVRTVSLNKTKHELIRDGKFLSKIWQQITRLAEKKQAPSLIYKEYDLSWKVVRDFFNSDVKRLIIDSREDFLRIQKFVLNLIGKEDVKKIDYYDGEKPLFDHKGISKQLETIYDQKVYLKSGAYVVIEPTEGLIVVDVNSGKFKTQAGPEEAAFMVNMEAAPEIARQLRLRDLGGIIVIDFIDMQHESHKRKVLGALQQALSKDSAKTEANRISNLGLVEMTRARTGKALEAISFKSCPYCEGRGKVKVV